MLDALNAVSLPLISREGRTRQEGEGHYKRESNALNAKSNSVECTAWQAFGTAMRTRICFLVKYGSSFGRSRKLCLGFRLGMVIYSP